MPSAAEARVRRYVDAYLTTNAAARLLAEQLDALGVGLLPLVDHITVRTHDVDRRAEEFLALGYVYDDDIGMLEFDDWWARVYRAPGLPAVFIDQAYEGDRGRTSLIPAWVNAHGDQLLHHIAVLVDDIERAIAALGLRGVAFSGSIVGAPGTSLRQIFTVPEMRDGQPFTVLELAERHDGYAGFLPPQADGLMKSSRGPGG